jgi:hypothetical protein
LDLEGKYELELESGTYTIVFSFVVTQPQEIIDAHIKLARYPLDVTLNTNSLETIVITTSVLTKYRKLRFKFSKNL